MRERTPPPDDWPPVREVPLDPPPDELPEEPPLEVRDEPPLEPPELPEEPVFTVPVSRSTCISSMRSRADDVDPTEREEVVLLVDVDPLDDPPDEVLVEPPESESLQSVSS